METFQNATLSDVWSQNAYYMYSLLCDYQKMIIDYGRPMSVGEFLKGWTCITADTFAKLRSGDYVYDCAGTRYIVLEEPYESDDESTLYVECIITDEDGIATNRTDILQCGDLYSENYTHQAFRWAKKKKEGDKLCPILITKTNQLQK